MDPAQAQRGALIRARKKAYFRLIPLLFVSYVVAYVDRVNIAFAQLTMTKDLPAFDVGVISLGASIFFAGYFLLEIPGAIIAERYSARRWIARIMISWGIVAALTAWVTTPLQFYGARFLLGLAEAGFFPGVIVYLTRWFPRQDRARAFAAFLMATPVAQVISPLLCNPLLKIGTTELVDGVEVVHPAVLGMHGWQWVFVAWGIPAVTLGLLVLLWLTDRPAQAKWLTAEEREALEAELAREAAEHKGRAHMSLVQALSQPRVLVLALAYFCVVTANYGTEFFMPKFLQTWYNLKISEITYLVVLPPIFALAGQALVGWSSDRTRERRLHTAVPIAIGALTLALLPFSPGMLPLTMMLLITARTGVKAYQPAFWTLPGSFLSSSAAAGAIGFINSIGNLGGFVGPNIVGQLYQRTGSFAIGLWVLAGSMALSVVVLLLLFRAGPRPAPAPEPKTAAA